MRRVSHDRGAPVAYGCRVMADLWFRDHRRRPRAAVLGPLTLAFFQVAGTFGAAQGQPDSRSPDVLAVLIALAGPASLFFVVRYPVHVLAWITGITMVYLLRDYPYGPVLISMVAAVVINVIRGHRYWAWAALATLLGVHFIWRGVVDDKSWSWGEFAGVSAWALLVLVFAEFARTRQERVIASRIARSESKRRRENEERLRIARELHDVVAHHMSLINVQAGSALHVLERRAQSPEAVQQAETALTAIKAASKEALTELRTLVGILRDEGEVAPRTPTGRLATLGTLIERAGTAGLRVESITTGTERLLPSTVDLAAFRIVQEAITNVIRHAGATRAAIVIGYGAEDLTITIDDDGHGITGPAGNGIQGMRERASALGGTLDVGQGPLGGTRVRAVLGTKGDS